MMNPFRITAAFGHRGNSGVRLHFDGRLPARTIRAEGGRQTRSANLASTGKTVEHIVVRMPSKGFSNLFVELLYGSNQATQLLGINLNG